MQHFVECYETCNDIVFVCFGVFVSYESKIIVT